MTIGRAALGSEPHARRRASFLTPRALASALRAHEEISDQDFERFVIARFRRAFRESTPLAVAVRAAQLLTGGKTLRVLDVGAGIGKFSIVGALTTSAAFTGVDVQLPLVRAARGIALRLGATHITFVNGSVADMEFRAFDGIYLFEGGRSQKLNMSRQSAGTEADQQDSAASCTSLTCRKLVDARAGTRIVTYCGRFTPPGCRVLHREPAGADQLALFVKE